MKEDTHWMKYYSIIRQHSRKIALRGACEWSFSDLYLFFLWMPLRKYPKGKKGCLNFTETRGEVREIEISTSLRVHYDRIGTGALVFGGIYRSGE